MEANELLKPQSFICPEAEYWQVGDEVLIGRARSVGSSIYQVYSRISATCVMLIYKGTADVQREAVAFTQYSFTQYSPAGTHCSICDTHDQWCEHIKAPKLTDAEKALEVRRLIEAARNTVKKRLTRPPQKTIMDAELTKRIANYFRTQCFITHGKRSKK